MKGFIGLKAARWFNERVSRVTEVNAQHDECSSEWESSN